MQRLLTIVSILTISAQVANAGGRAAPAKNPKAPSPIVRTEKITSRDDDGNFISTKTTRADGSSTKRSFFKAPGQPARRTFTEKTWKLKNGTVKHAYDRHDGMGALVTTTLASGIQRIDSKFAGRSSMHIQVEENVTDPVQAIAAFAAGKPKAFTAYVVDTSIRQTSSPTYSDGNVRLMVPIAPGDSPRLVRRKLAVAKLNMMATNTRVTYSTGTLLGAVGMYLRSYF